MVFPGFYLFVVFIVVCNRSFFFRSALLPFFWPRNFKRLLEHIDKCLLLQKGNDSSLQCMFMTILGLFCKDFRDSIHNKTFSAHWYLRFIIGLHCFFFFFSSITAIWHPKICCLVFNMRRSIVSTWHHVSWRILLSAIIHKYNWLLWNGSHICSGNFGK